MLVKYANAYLDAVSAGKEPSNRMYGWIDEYNDIKFNFPTVWQTYCLNSSVSPQHDAYDLFA